MKAAPEPGQLWEKFSSTKVSQRRITEVTSGEVEYVNIRKDGSEGAHRRASLASFVVWTRDAQLAV